MSFIYFTVTTPAPPNILKMDLVFAIDTSSSVDISLWNKLTQFVQDTITKFDLGQHTMKVGLLTFGQGAEYQRSFGQFKSRDQFLNMLYNIELPKHRYSANIYHALWQLRTDMFRGKADRRDAKNLVIFLVASPSSIGFGMLHNEARNVQRYGIEVLGYGLGPNVVPKEMKVIVQNPKNLRLLKRATDIDKYVDVAVNDILKKGTYKNKEIFYSIVK